MGLADILRSVEDDEESLKREIKEYLQDLGDGWISLWREAHRMVSLSDEGPQEVYQKTVDGFKREKLSLLIKEAQAELAACADDPHKQVEVFERMRGLKSQLDNMVRG
jgi:hypothetical protein